MEKQINKPQRITSLSIRHKNGCIVSIQFSILFLIVVNSRYLEQKIRKYKKVVHDTSLNTLPVSDFRIGV